MAEAKRLRVRVIRGIDLVAADKCGTSDPYCKLRRYGQKKWLKTKTIKKELNPVWNEVFEVVLTKEDKGDEDSKIEVGVWDWDAITKDDSLGSVVVDFAASFDPADKFPTKEVETIKLFCLEGVAHGKVELGFTPLNFGPSLAQRKKRERKNRNRKKNKKKKKQQQRQTTDKGIEEMRNEKANVKEQAEETNKDKEKEKADTVAKVNDKQKETEQTEVPIEKRLEKQEQPTDKKEAEGDENDEEEEAKEDEKVIKVRIIQGMDLIAADRNGYSDPYCKIIGGRRTHKTRIIKKTLDPVWEEEFTVCIKDNTFKIEAWDWDLFTKDDPLGQVTVDLNTTFSDFHSFPTKLKEVVTTIPLEDVESGRLEIGVTPLSFGKETKLKKKKQRKAKHTQENITQEQQEEDEKDESTLSTGDWDDEDESEEEDENESKIYAVKVRIIRARELVAGDKNGFSDPYCKVFAKQKTYSTKVIKKTLDPQWNEELNVHTKDSILLKVFDWNRIGSADRLGEISLSITESFKDVNDYPTQYKEAVKAFQLTGVASGQIEIGFTPLNFGAGYEELKDEQRVLDKQLKQEENREEEGMDYRCVKLRVISATNLIAADSNGSSDPFCRIKGAGYRIFKTKTKKKTLSPIWNDIFFLPVVDKIVVEVWDRDFARKEGLGTVVINLDADLSPEPEWPTKFKETIKVFKLQGVLHGQIQLGFTPQSFGTEKVMGLQRRNSLPSMRNLKQTLHSTRSPGVVFCSTHSLVYPFDLTPEAFATKDYNPGHCTWLVHAAALAYEDFVVISDVATNIWKFKHFSYFYDKTTGTKGFGMANDQFIIISFCGTKSMKHWSTNVKINTCTPFIFFPDIRVHIGFNKAFMTVASKVVKFIQRARQSNPQLPLFLTGHSLGGALANLAFAHFTLHNPPNGNKPVQEWSEWKSGDLQNNMGILKSQANEGIKQVRLAQSPIKQYIPVSAVYTFGQPAVACKELHEALLQWASTTVYYRVINNMDVVPGVPSGSYFQVGNVIHIEKTGEFAAKPVGLNYSGSFWKLKDHSVSTYVAKIISHHKSRGSVILRRGTNDQY
ncbi:Tricalbin-2 [Balamuthia mandrillaris]